MSTEKLKQPLIYKKVEGNGPTIEELMQLPPEEREGTPFPIEKWGSIALKMLVQLNNSIYSTLCLNGELISFLQAIDKQCQERQAILTEQMTPKTTGDWYTDWQNLEAMQREIDEIIIHDIIEPLVLEDEEN